MRKTCKYFNTYNGECDRVKVSKQCLKTETCGFESETEKRRK